MLNKKKKEAEDNNFSSIRATCDNTAKQTHSAYPLLMVCTFNRVDGAGAKEAIGTEAENNAKNGRLLLTETKLDDIKLNEPCVHQSHTTHTQNVQLPTIVWRQYYFKFI